MEEPLAGMKDRQHHVEGEEVEDRADRADNQHEIADEIHVPVAGMDQVIIIYPVQWNGQFGYVVKEIVEQDLHRQHREEGENKRGAGHAEHVAEIGAGSHHDVFHDIAKCAPSFLDAGMED
ncbi:hypothetical protein D9M69_386740 [compost metagenome]